MDSITQALLGACAAQCAASSKKLTRTQAVIAGAIAGTVPDLDVFFSKFSSDPLHGLIYHRHFTHALLFVPLGALIALLPFLFFQRTRGHWKALYVACFLGILTHGPLDLFTSYGTQILWPFSNHRWAWDGVSIVDLLFTVPLGVGVVLAWKYSSMKIARQTLAFCLLFLSFGMLQHQRAITQYREVIEQRGHHIKQMRVMPTLANLVVWRGVYVTEEGFIYSDRVRTPLVATSFVSQAPGAQVPHLTLEKFEGWLTSYVSDEKLKERFLRDFKVYEWFADGYLTWVDSSAGVLADVRYSQETAKFKPMWSLKFDARSSSEKPVERISTPRFRDEFFANWWAELWGND